MSSAEVLGPASVKPNPGHPLNQPKSAVKPPNNFKRKNKHERLRKRSKSFTLGGVRSVLPSKFLLGGNIKDPLNLNSLQDEETNRAMNAVTPKSSPVPTPPRKKVQIEVIIPKNIHDPLGLIDDADDDAKYEQDLCPPCKKPKKKRPKKRRTMSGSMDVGNMADSNMAPAEAMTPETSVDSAKIPDLPESIDSTFKAIAKKDLSIDLSLSPTKKEKQKRKAEDPQHHQAKKFKVNLDKIVSPVVPQPGAWLKRSISVSKPKHRPAKNKDEELQMPVFKDRDKMYQYGNYNRYYGYRNPNNEMDHRLRVFSHHSYLFGQRDILDIGCNIGHITLSIARDFNARSVTGIDIDPKLIAIARKNVKHYVKISREDPSGSTAADKPQLGKFKNKKGKQPINEKTSGKSSEFFPISMPILYGAIDVPGFSDMSNSKGFPANVTFKQCNYILENDNLLDLEQPQFDVILCLSVTKWIHLNWGDDGIKQAFRRMYAQLRPGGRLILEPQNWSSYKGKKKLTETIYRNYNTIEFFPEKFREYLLSPAVGFAKSEILGYPTHQAKGFRRPIQVFTKSTMFPSERIEATPQSITPLFGSRHSSDWQKTDNYVPHMRIECVEHVYTGLLDSRYCVSAEENAEINDKLGDELSNKQSQILRRDNEEKKIVFREEGSMEAEETFVSVGKTDSHHVEAPLESVILDQVCGEKVEAQTGASVEESDNLNISKDNT